MAESSSIQAASRLANHWYSRPGWKPGRLFDTWHLVFDDVPQVRELAGRCRAAVSNLPGLDLVSDQWLHMTVQGVGWSDGITDAERSAVVHAVVDEVGGLGVGELVLGPPLVKGEALVLSATPIDYLNALRDRIRLAVEKAQRRSPWNATEQASGFLPHVSIAYSRRDADAAPYAAALDTISPTTVQISVRHVALIQQDRQLDPHWRYIWRELARVPL